MRRIQFVELEDLPWIPKAIRDGATDVLDKLIDLLNFYQDAAAALPRLIEKTKQVHLLDLCSGGGGGTFAILKSLPQLQAVTLTCTDIYPNASAAARLEAIDAKRFKYHPQAVDAFHIPADLHGIRTMSSALHHFPPEAIQKLIASIMEQRQAFIFFDLAAAKIIRRLAFFILIPGLIVNFLMIFCFPFFLGLFIRPWNTTRFIFIYLIPLIPVLFAWDGTISALRAYEAEELLSLARSLAKADAYHFEAQQFGKALYIMGYPKT